MSKAWAGGSTRRWRKIRLVVLERDRWLCQIADCPRPTDRMRPNADPLDPWAPQVHHVIGKTYGDDPALLEAAHRSCNLRAGDPRKHTSDPTPRVSTLW